LTTILRLYNQFLAKDRDFAKRISSIIGFTPANLPIFRLAFHHKSSSTDKTSPLRSNERLEFLGDAVLSTIVAEYLFKKYPNGSEGFLTKMRSKIVKRRTLNQIADDMGLDVILREYNDTRLSDSMKGNALEALIGAIYLEKGYNGSKQIVIGRILRNHINIHELEQQDDNYKSQLLEWCQKTGRDVDYRMKQKYKFDKRDRFKIAVAVNGDEVASAEAFSKKSAEQLASQRALVILGVGQNGLPQE
jgi:ribonuclease III